MTERNQAAPSSVKRYLIALYAAAILLRVGLVVWLGSHDPQIVDAKDYDRLAMGLLKQGSYLTPSGELSSLRPPLYPAIVAVIYAMLGSQNWLAVAAFQSAISMLTMWMAHRLADRLLGPKVGLYTAAVVGFYPSLLAFNQLVLSECLFTFFFVGAVLASVRLQADGRWRDAVLLGICLGLGALTRSILWACTPPLLLYLVFTMKDRFPERVLRLATAAVVFALVLAPWAYRNTKLHQTFTLVDVMGGRNVMMGNYEFTPLERSWATVSDVRGDQAWHRVLADATPDYSGLTQGQIDKRAMKYGIRFFFTNPTLTAKRCVVRFFNFWQLERTISAGLRAKIWGDVSPGMFLVASALFCGVYAWVVISAIFGAFHSSIPWRQHGLLLLWMALPCIIHTVAFAHSRYHLPLVPILAIYSGNFLVRSTRPERTDRRLTILAFVVSAILVMGWIRELVVVDFALIG